MVYFEEPLLHSGQSLPRQCTCCLVQLSQSNSELSWPRNGPLVTLPGLQHYACFLTWAGKVAKPLNPRVARVQQLGSKGEKRNSPRSPWKQEKMS